MLGGQGEHDIEKPQEVQGVTSVLRRPRHMEIEKGEKDFPAKNSGKKKSIFLRKQNDCCQCFGRLV